MQATNLLVPNQTEGSCAPFLSPREGGGRAPRGVVSAALDTRFRGYDGEVHGYQLLNGTTTTNPPVSKYLRTLNVDI